MSTRLLKYSSCVLHALPAVLLCMLPILSVQANTFISGQIRGNCNDDVGDGLAGSEPTFSAAGSTTCTDTTSNFWRFTSQVSAYAEPGRLGVMASMATVGIVVPEAAIGQSDNARASIGAYDNDVLTIDSGPQNGAIVFEILTTGTTSTSVFQFASPAQSSARINGSLTTSGRDFETTIALDGNQTGNERVSVRVPFENGSLRFKLFLNASVECRLVGVTTRDSCVASADAFNSATVVGGQVFDENGILFEDAVVTSNSGFDYLAGHQIAGEDDKDEDDVADVDDNCPAEFNPLQLNSDDDVLGDVCDMDDDNDTIDDVADNCPLTINTDQADFDGDGQGDTCDTDIDGDGVVNDYDICAETLLGVQPSRGTRKNRFYSSMEGEFIDDSGKYAGVSLSDTGGCSGQQIIVEAGLGEGHVRYGISRSALESWMAQLSAR